MLIFISTMANAADVTITIPNDKVEQVKTSLFWYGTQQLNMVQGEEETDLVFAKRIIRQLVLIIDQRYRGLVARELAEQSVSEDTTIIEE